jgi:hypothetical protein
MSDIKLQESSPNELDGGLTPEQILAADIRSRQGHNCPQNNMSFSRGTEVNFGSAPSRVSQGEINGVSPAPQSVTSDVLTGVAGVQVSVLPVDRRTIEGSYSGDSRKKASDAVLPANPAPRSAVGQAPFRKGA